MERPEGLRRAAMALLILVAAVATSPAAGQASAPPPAASATGMTNEDVVRMVARGTSPEEVIRAVRDAPSTSFDLDADMVVELRRAGVPEAVIAAMRAKQPAVAEAPRQAPPAPTGTIELVFDRDPSGELRKRTAVTLAAAKDQPPVTFSFFVLCLDSLHVPDLWDTKTPLREGFPRHEMVWFLEATKPGEPIRRAPTVYLDLPERARVPLAAGRHPLMAGVAARVGDGPWTPVAFAETTLEVKETGTTPLVLRVRTARIQRLADGPGMTPWITCEVMPAPPAPPPGS